MIKLSEIILDPKTPIMTEDEFLQFQVNHYNEEEGHLNEEDGVECKECKNKGYVAIIRHEELYNSNQFALKRCKCLHQRKLARRAIHSGLGEYLNKRSNDYETNEDWQKQYFSMMVDYCKNEGDTSKWIIACGQSGSGKTLLCSIIANHLLYNLNKSVLYITWTDFISRLKRDMMGDNTDEVTTYLEEVKTSQVLFLDELLKKYNETDLKYLIEIINYRYTNNLKTIITSERTIDELLDIDEATFGRVIEKCGKFIIDIPKDRTKNYRLKHLFK